MARIKPSYRRISSGRPPNSSLENVKARLPYDMDMLLCEKIAEQSPDYFVCAIFSVALGLTTSNIAMENLIDNELQDELSIFEFAIELCFKVGSDSSLYLSHCANALIFSSMLRSEPI
jgi:hypothetical protein